MVAVANVGTGGAELARMRALGSAGGPVTWRDAREFSRCAKRGGWARDPEAAHQAEYRFRTRVLSSIADGHARRRGRTPRVRAARVPGALGPGPALVCMSWVLKTLKKGDLARKTGSTSTGPSVRWRSTTWSTSQTSRTSQMSRTSQSTFR